MFASDHFVDPNRYYQFITMHGMIMVIYLLTALFLGGRYRSIRLRRSQTRWRC